MMTDADFIREVQSCERTLYRVSRTILSSDADCCDAVQEALTRAWKHRNDVNPSFFKTWLVRILINECHNIGRRLKRVTPVEKMPDQLVWQAEETGIMEALQNIKEPWRIVLTMHELEGFTYSEIAAVTHTPEIMVDPPATEELAKIEGVLGVEELGSMKFRIRFTEAQEVIDRIVKESAAKDWRLSEIRVEKSSLDSIFAELSKKAH